MTAKHNALRSVNEKFIKHTVEIKLWTRACRMGYHIYEEI